MRLSETDILKLLPEFMRSDEANIALSAAINAIAIAAYTKIKTFSVWDQIDKLDDTALDALASDLNIPWYRSTADIATKRAVIKSSDLVFAKLGTPWAVEKLMSDYYGNMTVQEWWIYGGKPGHFRLVCENSELARDPSVRGEALALLELCKRKSSKLDNIAIVLTSKAPIYTGICLKGAHKKLKLEVKNNGMESSGGD